MLRHVIIPYHQYWQSSLQPFNHFHEYVGRMETASSSLPSTCPYHPSSLIIESIIIIIFLYLFPLSYYLSILLFFQLKFFLLSLSLSVSLRPSFISILPLLSSNPLLTVPQSIHVFLFFFFILNPLSYFSPKRSLSLTLFLSHPYLLSPSPPTPIAFNFTCLFICVCPSVCLLLSLSILFHFSKNLFSISCLFHYLTYHSFITDLTSAPFPTNTLLLSIFIASFPPFPSHTSPDTLDYCSLHQSL